MKKIPTDELAYHPMSNGEPDVRLFWWQGEPYRGVGGERAPFFRDLFKRGILQELADNGLIIETTLTPHTTEEHDLVMRHKRIPFVSCPFEWPSSMLRDAALLVCELQAELDSHGFMLEDSYLQRT